jgi:hypothetical protein
LGEVVLFHQEAQYIVGGGSDGVVVGFVFAYSRRQQIQQIGERVCCVFPVRVVAGFVQDGANQRDGTVVVIFVANCADTCGSAEFFKALGDFVQVWGYGCYLSYSLCVKTCLM